MRSVRRYSLTPSYTGGKIVWYENVVADGDFDGDNDVDGDDFLLWHRGFVFAVPSPSFSDGDADLDEDVDGDDLSLWERQFGDDGTRAANFDSHGFVDGGDFLAWQRGFGRTAPSAVQSDGDADGDGIVNARDLNVWQSQYDVIADPTADFDSEGNVNGHDLLVWQRGFTLAAPNAAQSDGDADGDLDVDGHDLVVWASQYGLGSSPAALASEESELAGPMAEASSSNSRGPRAKPDAWDMALDDLFSSDARRGRFRGIRIA